MFVGSVMDCSLGEMSALGGLLICCAKRNKQEVMIHNSTISTMSCIQHNLPKYVRLLTVTFTNAFP